MWVYLKAQCQKIEEWNNLKENAPYTIKQFPSNILYRINMKIIGIVVFQSANKKDNKFYFNKMNEQV